MSCDDIAIRVSGLSKCYHIYDRPQDRLKQALWRGRKQFYRDFWALRAVSFEIRKGETFAIIGRNGSGKSTLLQLIAGTLTPTSGTVEVNGRVAALLELGSGFNPEFTGRENVFMNGAILGLSEAEIAARFDEIAAFANIGDFIDQAVKTYSSGMMLRLAFAVSVCVEPDILIVDEALAVGDMAFQIKCMERLERLVKSGTTLLFVSHDMAAVKSFCQRAIYLERGNLKSSGMASDIAELYFLDVRDEQRQALGGQPLPERKVPIGSHDSSFAFGTSQGSLTAACFHPSGSIQYSFNTGEQIEILVDYSFHVDVSRPSLSIFVTDTRMLDLAGGFYWLDLDRAQRSGDGWVGRARVSFPARFATGSYFITLRLEERASETQFFPIDKQVGALFFQMQRQAGQQRLGILDLDFGFESLPPVQP